VKLTVARLGHRGDGVAEDGTFVPGTLPGEEVEGEVTAGRMATPRIVTPAPQRVRPPCPHYRSCGGCALQHAADDFVADWKQQVLCSALSAQRLAAPFRRMHVSPPRSRRRATLAGRRLKRGALVGFHARASDLLVAVPECHLLHPDLIACLPALEEITAIAASRKGELTFTVTRSEAGPDVAVRAGRPLDARVRLLLTDAATRHRLARLAWDDEPVVQRAAPVHRFGKARVVPPPGAFLQATAEGEAALLAAVRDAVGSARKLADLFAGCGTFTLPLAENAEVHAAEGDAAMLAALDAGWRATPGLRRVTAEARDLFRRPLTAAELSRFDAVVIDPPRAGSAAQVAQIALAGVQKVAFVACNPITFARDCRVLVDAGYTLDWVQVVDQFRWSPHVEIAARLTAPPRRAV
jgi:23S rRNA (uracil1939-C5)-methyltransferase